MINFRPRWLTLALGCIALVGAVNSASATGFIASGSRSGSDGGTTVTTSGQSIQLALEANRSYACSLLPQSAGAQLIINQSILAPGSSQSMTYVGSSTPAMTGADASGRTRVSYIPTATGNHVLSVENNSGSSQVARLECIETTLYGGYNTNASPFNFLELINITNTAIVGQITAVNFDGTTVINQQSFSVSPNNRTDVDLHTPAGANKFGALRVTFIGPYGGLQGFVSQYRSSGGALELKASIPLTPRAQNL